MVVIFVFAATRRYTERWNGQVKNWVRSGVYGKKFGWMGIWKAKSAFVGNFRKNAPFWQEVDGLVICCSW